MLLSKIILFVICWVCTTKLLPNYYLGGIDLPR